jgi:hypothetical protein
MAVELILMILLQLFNCHAVWRKVSQLDHLTFWRALCRRDYPQGMFGFVCKDVRCGLNLFEVSDGEKFRDLKNFCFALYMNVFAPLI